MKNLFKLMLLAALACPLFVSCYDDSELRETVDMLVDKVFDLEQKLNDEIATLKGLLEGKIFVTEVALDPSGSTNVTLSNGSVLQLLPQKDLKSYVTYVTLTDGTDCWAYIDENGQKQLFLDEKKHPIPVVAETPQVITKDDETYIVIGGQEYPLSGNSVFSDYEVITDEETGEVLAVTFTFGEAMTFTVSVNAAQGFWFVKEDSQETVKFDSYFVQAGKTVSIQVKSKGVEDYVVQLPYGWKNREAKIAGLDYFQITAPSAELLASGAADSEGNVKVLAVLEGGKASAARLYVSTSPFKTMNTSYGKLTLDPYPGVAEYVYGICAASAYDKQAIVAAVNEGKMPKGGVEMSEAIVSIKLEELTDLAFVVGTEYVVWAYPVAEGDLIEDVVSERTFKYTLVEVAVVDEAFLDAAVSLNLGGLDGYYIGVSTAKEYDEEVVLSSLNSGVYSAKTEPMNTKTSVFELTGVTANHSTDYVMWFTVAETGKKYAAEDLIVIPFSTSTFEEGGNAAVSVDDDSVAAAPTSIQATLNVTDGTMFFYTFVKADSKVAKGTDEEIIDHLLKKGVQVEGTSAVVSTKDKGVSLTALKPETDVMLLALAVDAEGKYGQLLKYGTSTSPLTYNDIKVTAEVKSLDPGNVKVKVSATSGAKDYIYWVGLLTDNFWKSSTYLGSDAGSAAKYMALNQENYRFLDMKAAYPVADGMIVFDDLDPGSKYVFVCVAVDENGMTSQAAVTNFQVYSRALGNIVYKTDPRWEAAKPTVNFIAESFRVGGEYGGEYDCSILANPDFVAYILLTSIDYATLESLDESGIEQPALKMLYIISNADKPRDASVLVDNAAWVDQGYPYGWEFYRYPHGFPAHGYGVLWPDEATHHAICGVNHPAVDKTVVNGIEISMPTTVYYYDGNPVVFTQKQGSGNTTDVIEAAYVVCQDREGNCYEAFEFPVDPSYYANAPAMRE